MHIEIGTKVLISSDAEEYIGRVFGSVGMVFGMDVEGDYLVKTPVTSKGRFIKWSTGMWIKPMHLRIKK